MASSVSTTIQVLDPVQSENSGDRTGAPGKNAFNYNPATAEFLSSYNQTDVKAEVAGITPQTGSRLFGIARKTRLSF